MFNRPVSAKQAAANKANATLSTGPRTAKGKAATARNATSHGLCTATVAVHYWESQEEFDLMRTEYFATFQPKDRVQRDLVDRMVDCTWRRNRAVSMETTLLNLQIEEMSNEIFQTFEEPHDGLLRVSLAFLKRHGEGVWDSLTRHITAAERGYQRAFRELRLLQELPVAPTEHSPANQPCAPETERPEIPRAASLKSEKQEITKQSHFLPPLQELPLSSDCPAPQAQRKPAA